MAAKEMPKVGDKVWYRLGDRQHNYEWLEATVVDGVKKGEVPGQRDDDPYDTPNEGTLHLRCDTQRLKHHSPGSHVWRKDAPGPGTEPGMWNYERPANADEEFKKVADERKQSAEFHRTRMRETRGR